jgi:hypothetical protein
VSVYGFDLRPGNRRGLYLTERDSDGQEVLPVTLVRPNQYTERAGMRMEDTTIHIITGFDVGACTYCRITGIGDTLIWARPIIGPQGYEPVGNVCIGPDGAPWISATGAYDSAYATDQLLIRFGEDASQTIYYPFANLPRRYWATLSGIDTQYHFHFMTDYYDSVDHWDYMRLDTSFAILQTVPLDFRSVESDGAKSDLAGNSFFVVKDGSGLSAAFLHSNGTWVLAPVQIDPNMFAYDFSIVTMDTVRYAFTCTGSHPSLGEEFESLRLYTYGFPPYNAAQTPPSIAREFALSAYPNPFNSSTRIRFDVAKRGPITLNVFDLQGRLVQTLADGIMESGQHELSLSGEHLASGMYFVRLRTAETIRTEKILLLK